MAKRWHMLGCILSLGIAGWLLGCSKPAETTSAVTAPVAVAESRTTTTAQTTQPVTSPESPTASAGKTINVYMWSEYIDPELLTKFKQQTGITVNLSVYEASEDMLAKLQQAGGVSQYDVIVASDHTIPVMQKLNLIQPLDAAQLPNMKNVDVRFANPPYDRGSKYSMPYQWGTQGVIINKQMVPQYEESWGLFLEPGKQPGQFILIDSMRDMLAAALKFQGHSINSKNPADLKAAADLIQQAKKSPKSLGFEGGAGGKNRVADGTAAMAIVYNGDALKAIDEDKDGRLAFFVPREGTLIWVDAMVIPAKAPNRAGAYQFINFILDPEVGAILSNFNKYATPNKASMAHIKPEDRDNKSIYPPEEQMGKMEFLEDVGDSARLYDETWTAIKAK